MRKRDSNVGGASNTNADRGNGDEDWNELLGRYIEEEEVEEELLGRGQRSRKRVQYYKTKAGSEFLLLTTLFFFILCSS